MNSPASLPSDADTEIADGRRARSTTPTRCSSQAAHPVPTVSVRIGHVALTCNPGVYEPLAGTCPIRLNGFSPSLVSVAL